MSKIKRETKRDLQARKGLINLHSIMVSPFAIGKADRIRSSHFKPRVFLRFHSTGRHPSRSKTNSLKIKHQASFWRRPAFHLVCLFAGPNRRSTNKIVPQKFKSTSRTCATIPCSRPNPKTNPHDKYAPTSKLRRPIHNNRGSGASMRSRNTGDRF